MKNKIQVFVISLIVTLTGLQAQEWEQIGIDIIGEQWGDYCGNSVSISNDGSIIAIGAYFNSGNGNQSGHVRIYENQNGSWVQVGSDINGAGGSHRSGYSVDLNNDGTIVAIGSYGANNNAGHVRVFERNQDDNWIQVGNNIVGEASEDYSGDLSLSASGTILAIGAEGNDGNGSNSGHVRIYENQAGTWTQIGQDIDGESAGDDSGSDISLSDDGTTVAIGAVGNDGNGSGSGHVRIYEYQTDTWVQIGNDINGEGSWDCFGNAVSLNADGSILAIGAKNNDGNGNTSGHVRVFENQSGNWVQIGSDIDGDVAGGKLGYSVSIDESGTIVCIGARFENAIGTNSGYAKVYQNLFDEWVQLGSTMYGDGGDDEFGYSVAIDGNGENIVIGAPNNDSNGNNSGQAKAFELLYLPIISSQPESQANICSGELIQFSITANDVNSYQWQLSTDEGNVWVDLTDDGVYTNTTSSSLNVNSITLDMNNNQYRCVLSNDDGNTLSDVAILTTDNEAPVTPSLSDVTEECSVTVVAPTTSDNCTGTITGTTTNPTEYTEQGTYTIIWTFEDGSGNSTTANQTIIVDDITNPEIVCLANQEVGANQTGFYTVQGTEFDPEETSDNCEIESIENDFNNTETLANAEFPEGVTTITWTIIDVAGNVNTCSFDVIVNAFVGIDKLKQKGISISPNPIKNQLIINSKQLLIEEIKIRDFTGKEVYNSSSIIANSAIDLSNLDSGIYIISIQADNKIYTKRLVKE